MSEQYVIQGSAVKYLGDVLHKALRTECETRIYQRSTLFSDEEECLPAKYSSNIVDLKCHRIGTY